MDSFEWNKIIGAVLGTVIFIFVVRLVAEHIYEPEHPEKPGYIVEGVVEAPTGGAAAPVEEPMPDWGTVLASADLGNGKSLEGRCAQCHDITKGGPNKIGPNLFGVVDRPRATHAGFAYSSAMKNRPGNWTYDELFKFIKSPAIDIPGTKMSFAGIRSAQDRIDLIAYLRSNADSPAPIPPPKPAAPAEAPPAKAGETAPAGAPAKAGETAPADAPAKDAAKPAPAH
jgi:cytochrome c